MWQNLKEIGKASIRFWRRPSLETLIKLVAALAIASICVFIYLYAQISGHSIWADAWSAISPHVKQWISSNMTLSNWEVVLFGLAAFCSVSVNAIVAGRRWRLPVKVSAGIVGSNETYTNTIAKLTADLSTTEDTIAKLAADVRMAQKGTAGLAAAFKSMEALVNSIVEITDKSLVAVQYSMSTAPTSGQSSDIRAQLRWHVEDAISSMLGLAIECAVGFLGGAVYRGAILLPHDDISPWLDHYADSGWNDRERQRRFYIRLHPNNSSGAMSVAGAAYWLKQPQLCRWQEDAGQFDHAEYSPSSNAVAPTGRPRSFVALPLQANYLSLRPSDFRVLGILCFDATDPHEFDGHVVLESEIHDIPVFSMMRIMFQLLTWRAHALEIVESLLSVDES